MARRSPVTTPRVVIFLRMWLPRVVATAVLSVAFLVGLVGCALVLSFDYDTSRATLDGGPTTDSGPTIITGDANVAFYAVGGNVDGVDRGVPVTVHLNGASQTRNNGPFSFPAAVADGGDYAVTVEADARYACSVER